MIMMQIKIDGDDDDDNDMTLIKLNTSVTQAPSSYQSQPTAYRSSIMMMVIW